MNCVALIPIKARRQCKSRLASVLDAYERQDLARWMLSRVLQVARASSRISQIIVISPERDDLEGVNVIQDTGTDLNGALQCGRDWCARSSQDPILVLAADLPFLTAVELDDFICASLKVGVGIATDRAGQGTNALLLGQPSTFKFHFGPDSRAGHEAEASRLGVRPIVRQTPGLAMDVDEPEDLNRIRRGVRIPFQCGNSTW